MGAATIKNHVLTHNGTVGHATVVSNRLEPKGYAVPGLTLDPTYITIHNVGDDDVPGINWYNALHNANAEGWRTASWHVTIDYNKIYQSLRFNTVAWHAGDGKNGTGNRHSIGIENCQYSKDKEKQRQVWENCAELCILMMKAYPKITKDHIVQHYYWTKKDCPYLLRHKRFNYDWTWFKKLVTDKQGNVVKPVTSEFKPYVVRVIVDTLNIRKGPGVSNEKCGMLIKGDAYTIIEEKGGWGKLKFELGWINISPKYVQKV